MSGLLFAEHAPGPACKERLLLLAQPKFTKAKKHDAEAGVKFYSYLTFYII